MSKLSGYKSSLIKKWLQEFPHFTSDGKIIFCVACSKESAISEYHNCYQKGLVILEATLRAINGNSLPEFFSALCRISRSVEAKCTDVFLINIRPCLKGIDIDALQLYKDTSLAIHRYLCSNRGRYIADFYSTMSVNATECAREKWQCIRSHLQGAYRTGYGFLQLERFLLTPEGCRSRKEAVACLYRTVDFCDGDSAAGVIDGFFNSSMAVAMPCFSEESLQWANH
ncbi:uncharacterized protein [Anabrus simplex]|uniref:uncharacterized protein isoform X2 n=1 Tax=Anabrus simplex TaxID=316456 RepID=UPI0035A3073B